MSNYNCDCSLINFHNIQILCYCLQKILKWCFPSFDKKLFVDNVTG